ncbi:MAG: sigma-70 family RNA polymerase sigma factor [Bacteroidetes bacterium]|nr:sigma-70 family RNA polymerase sigma factor [Bacteroidota bacterium]
MNLPENPEALFEIIEGCIRGERNCQQKIYESFYGTMMGLCLRYTKDKDDALDVLQDGFIKVFLNLKHFGNKGSLEGWMRKIMVNTAIDFYRRNKKSLLFADSEYVEKNAEEVTEENNNEEEFLSISASEIMEAVQQLTPAYRTVFNMYVVDGYTHKEIAEQLGINEGTSKSNFAKAKKNLKKVLAKKTKVVNEQV